MTASGFDLVSGILIFIAAIVPIYFSIRLKNNFLRLPMVVLSVFAMIHGTYHILEVLHYEMAAETVVEPLSYAVLIVFGLIYLRIRSKKTRTSVDA
jgi:hypothetical protein